MATPVWAAPLPLSEELFTKPEAIGPFVDLQAAKLAGEAPYVIRDAVTGNIHDRIRNDVYPSSEDYARCGGHQSYVDVPMKHKGHIHFSGCWKCGKIYDLVTMRSYVSAAEFESQNGCALDPLLIHIDASKACMHEWSKPRKPGDCWKAPKISQKEVADALNAFRADDSQGDNLQHTVRVFLEQFATAEAVEDFLLANDPAHSSRETGKAFAAALKKDCLNWLKEQGRKDYELVALPLGAERRQKVMRLANLREQYLSASPLEREAIEEPLRAAVLRFATRRAEALMIGAKKETAVDFNDLGQESAISLLLNSRPLGSITEQIIKDAVQAEHKRTKDLATEKRSRRSLDLLIVGEDGSLDDNPLIYARQQQHERAPALPHWLQGTDRKIVQLVNEGESYQEISRVLGLSQDALKQRVLRMKKRAKAEQN